MPLISTRKLRRFFLVHTKYRKDRFPHSLPLFLDRSHDRAEVVKEACRLTKANRYLEIGCFSDYTFKQILVAEKIGVDPESGGTHRMTSDDFFAGNTMTFDVIFIDGLHEYKQVRKDIINSLAVLNQGGMIVVDDMIPIHWTQEHMDRISNNWTGNVWKCAFEISATDGLDFKILLCDSGTGVIKPQAKHDNLVDLGDTLTDKTFSYLYENYRNLPTIGTQAGLDWMKS